MSWAISAHGRLGAIRQAARSGPPGRSSTRRAASTCMRSTISSSNRSAPPVKASTSRRARSIFSALGANARLQGSIWSGWIKVLPSKPSCRPSSPPRAKPFGSSSRLNTPSNAAMPAARAASTIICSDAEIGSRAASSGRRRSARRSFVPAISAAASSRDLRRRRARPRPSRSSPARACPIASRDLADQMGRRGPRQDDEVALRSRDGIDVGECHSRADAVDADRHRHRPALRRPRRPPPPRLLLVLRLHRIFEVEHDQVRVALPAPSRSLADWMPAGTAPTARRTDRALIPIFLPLAPGRRIMRRRVRRGKSC